MEHSKRVFDICRSNIGKSVEEFLLKMHILEHPDVDVNLFQDHQGWRALHVAAARDHVACARLLIAANADLELRDQSGLTALAMACDLGRHEYVQVLIESNADVETVDYRGTTSLHTAAGGGFAECLNLLINANADVNRRDICNGSTPAMSACAEDRLTCLQLLVDNKANLDVVENRGFDALFAGMMIPPNEPFHRVPGFPFAVLSCNTDGKNVLIAGPVTHAIVDAHIKEYKQIHAFIDGCHAVTEHALSEDVVVDTRVGRGDYGMYHEPLEQVLLYLGLSMDKNQTVNASIDGKSIKRAFIPYQLTNANLWFELYQRTHCSSCSARVAKPRHCPCYTARYCNGDCQRQHWKTHRHMHKAAMLILKEKKEEPT
jgi:hypothetical protein